jgi:hypothetical protein
MKNATLPELQVTCRQTPDLKVGDRWVVFARGGLIGQSPQLEAAALLGADQAQGFAGTAELVNLLLRGKNLAKRLDAARLVVSGRVEAMMGLDRGQSKEPTHLQGDWPTATIRVDTVLKGHERQQTLSVTLRADTTGSGKSLLPFKVGDEGIWILLGNAADGPYSMAEFAGFVRVDQLPLVKSLLSAK